VTAFIAPIEAFRIILRAIYPDNPRLAARIKSRQYFFSGQRKYKYRLPPESPVEGTAPDHLRYAHEALRILEDGVRSQKIALQGARGAEPPAPINSADSATGKFDVFAETLEIHTRGVRDYLYQRVWCSRTDVIALVGSPAGTRPARLTTRTAREFVNSFPNGTLDEIRRAARKAGFVGARPLIDEQYRLAHGGSVRPGRRRKSARI
jgi:hypothetical protein